MLVNKGGRYLGEKSNNEMVDASYVTLGNYF